MLKNKITKRNDLIAQLKSVWENDHGEEMTEAYNEIVGILGKLDMYSANILVNLLWLQAVQKTYLGTVGKPAMPAPSPGPSPTRGGGI